MVDRYGYRQDEQQGHHERGEIAYGKPVIFSIVSNANYRLGAIKQASSDVDISKIKGTYANGNTSYTYTTPI